MINRFIKSYNKYILLVIFFIPISNIIFAQQDTTLNNGDPEERITYIEKISDKLKKITITGHIQGQYIYAEPDAVLRIGSPNENPNDNFSRVGIRQGRMRVMFEEGITSAVLQLDLSERGVNVVDVFAQIKDPWTKTSFFRAGQFFRPFGHELRYPTSRRETPERSRIITTLFPGLRDIGGMLHLQLSEMSPLHFLEMDLALIAGNGPHSETDSKRDFIGYFGATPQINENISLHFGVSYYWGNVFQGTSTIYKMEGKRFVADINPDNMGKFARREYLGFDLQVTYGSKLGKSQLRGEYIFGKQPGSEVSSISPNSSVLPSYDTYLRDFRGGYVTYVQDMGKIPFSAYIRYDWYDPNTKISGNDIIQENNTSGDISYSTLGIGLIWKVTKSLDINGYYEFVSNETTVHIPEFSKDKKDNVFTLTLMYRY